MNGWWGGHMDGWGGMGPGGLGAVVVVLVGVLLVALVVALAWLLLRRPAAPQPAVVHRAPGPREMLDGRFATGDIDEAEYRSRLAVLDERP